MFIVANTRRPATTSSMFEFDFEMEFLEILATKSGADLGFSERGANYSSGSLKQGVWGAQPPRSYRMFCFMKYRNAI